MEKRRICGIAAGLCYAGLAAYMLSGLVSQSFIIWTFIGIVGNVLLAAACFAAKPAGAAIGAAVCAVPIVRSVIDQIKIFGILNSGAAIYIVLPSLLGLVYLLLLFIAGTSKKRGRAFAFAAGTVDALRFAYLLIAGAASPLQSSLTVLSIVITLLKVGGAFLFGFSVEKSGE